MSSSIASKERATGAGGLVVYDFDILSLLFFFSWEPLVAILSLVGMYVDG